MTTEKQIEIAEQIIASGLCSKVFHSCQVLKTEATGMLFPAYPHGSDYIYSGIDDTKGLFAYIRDNGDMSSVPFKITAGARSYQVTAPLRVVFFSDNEKRDQNDLLRRLSAFTFLKNVTLVRIVTDKFKLVRDESSLFREKFDGQTFYAAVDVTVSFVLLHSDCETDICKVYSNPVTTCPAAVQKSIESATS